MCIYKRYHDAMNSWSNDAIVNSAVYGRQYVDANPDVRKSLSISYYVPEIHQNRKDSPTKIIPGHWENTDTDSIGNTNQFLKKDLKKHAEQMVRDRGLQGQYNNAKLWAPESGKYTQGANYVHNVSGSYGTGGTAAPSETPPANVDVVADSKNVKPMDNTTNMPQRSKGKNILKIIRNRRRSATGLNYG